MRAPKADWRGRVYKLGPHLYGHATRVDLARVPLYQKGLARRVRDARLEAGVSRAELAAAMGTSEGAVYRLEKCQRDPKYATIVRVALALGLSPTELV